MTIAELGLAAIPFVLYDPGMNDEAPLTSELLGQEQAADFLGMSCVKLVRMRRAGIGPRFYSDGPRTIRYRKSDLKEWHETQFRSPTSAPSGPARTSVGAGKLPKNAPCPVGYVSLHPSEARLVSDSLPMVQRRALIKSSWCTREDTGSGMMHWYVRRDAIVRCPGLTQSMREKAGITDAEILAARDSACGSS